MNQAKESACELEHRQRSKNLKLTAILSTPESLSAGSSLEDNEDDDNNDDQAESLSREKIDADAQVFTIEESERQVSSNEEDGEEDDEEDEDDEDIEGDEEGDDRCELGAFEDERGADGSKSVTSAGSYRPQNEGCETPRQLRWAPAINQQQLQQQHQQQHQQPQKDCEEVKQVELFGVCIVALTINGKERLCLAQISNTLLKEFSYNEIHNRRVALGITCVQCTPIQLEMLRRAGAMPSSSRRCGMITMREAERLCRSFLVEEQPPELPENFYFTVAHRVNYGCKGRFIPARYISSRAKCIECFYCGEFYSPNKFIFHSHRQPHVTDCNPPDSPNINSWRKHIDLDWTQEHNQEIKYAWEDVKSLFNGGTRRRAPNWPTSANATETGGGTNANSSSQQRQQSAKGASTAAAKRNGRNNNNNPEVSSLDFDEQVIDVECDFDTDLVVSGSMTAPRIGREPAVDPDGAVGTDKIGAIIGKNQQASGAGNSMMKRASGKTTATATAWSSTMPSSEGSSQSRYSAAATVGRQSSNSLILNSAPHQQATGKLAANGCGGGGGGGDGSGFGGGSGGSAQTGVSNKRQQQFNNNLDSNNVSGGALSASKRFAAYNLIGPTNRQIVPTALEQHHQVQIARDKLGLNVRPAVNFQLQHQQCPSQQQQVAMNQSLRQIQPNPPAQFGQAFLNLSPTQTQRTTGAQNNGTDNSIKASPPVVNLAAYPVSANPNFIYSQLYSQLMHQQQQSQQANQQQLSSTMDAQLALRQHLWSSLLANLQCNSSNQTYGLAQQQTAPSSPQPPQPPQPPPVNLVGHCGGPQMGETGGLLNPAANQLSHLISAQLYAAHQPTIAPSKLRSRPNQTGSLDAYAKASQPVPFALHKFSAGEANDI